jgi:hypothetical protein
MGGTEDRGVGVDDAEQSSVNTPLSKRAYGSVGVNCELTDAGSVMTPVSGSTV